MKQAALSFAPSETQARWQQMHRRYAVVHRVIDAGRIDDQDPEIKAVFPDRAELVRALFQQWTTLMGGCVDFALEVGQDHEGEETLRAAHRAALRRSPSLYRLIVQESSTPLGERLNHQENVRLACAVGIAHAGETSAQAAAVVSRILASVDTPSAVPTPGWFRSAVDWIAGREVEGPERLLR
ncbi:MULTISPECIES: hypothetical protein [unclassified Nocardioides]|uniref:hypothetical protein n=1 Tax=unclassified Nocardioides TaxID=2615069 RepID=UPI0006F8238F|nr:MULTISPECIES: hypothetical protein [unclassified Nocardioides]KRA38698.1 hypothetical protein ASD81_08865 [Nocardioides sp. Root614]KRA92658.1 hypothetical protein ASD84_09130 [Nocardioides sp. Root682]